MRVIRHGRNHEGKYEIVLGFKHGIGQWQIWITLSPQGWVWEAHLDGTEASDNLYSTMPFHTDYEAQVNAGETIKGRP